MRGSPGLPGVTKVTDVDWNDSSDPSETQHDPWDEYAEQASTDEAQDRWDEWSQLGYDTPDGPGGAVPLPHSGLGIASVILTVFAGLGVTVSVVAATVLALQNPALPEDNPQIIAAGCGILASLFLAAVGGLLGLIGLFQPNRNRLFAILGCVFAVLELGGVGALLVIGLLFG